MQEKHWQYKHSCELAKDIIGYQFSFQESVRPYWDMLAVLMVCDICDS